MSFFDVFSGAPYGSDFLILTKGIIKKVPKGSAKKYCNYSNSQINSCHYTFLYSSPPSADNLLKIAHSLNTSCEFLLTGIEQKYRCSEFESEVLSLFRSLPHDAQLEFRGELKGYIKCVTCSHHLNPRF